MLSDIEKGILSQDHKSIAKAITLVEDNDPISDTLLSNLFSQIFSDFH